MSRNGSGTYSLPAGQPVVTGTTISASTFNTLTSDLSTEVTDSLSRSAKGAMLGILQLHDGTSATVPDLTWSGDIDTGLGHSGANILDIIAGGATMGVFTSTSSKLIGNQAAGGTGADVISDTTATRTAGVVHSFRNNTTEKLAVSFSGGLIWPSAHAETATSPGPSAETAISLPAGWTAAGTPAYWKDPCGMVHIKGSGTWTTGASTTLVTLPAGFRPATTKMFVMPDLTNNTNTAQIQITTAGVITTTTPTNGHVYSFDSMNFLAEA